MLELCYYSNGLMYIFIFFYPESKFLYYGIFALASGPLAWSLPLVECKFVLHSIDKLTSVFIHFTPMILIWNLHWRTQYSKDRQWALYDSKNDKIDAEFFKTYYFSAASLYFIWAILYYLIVFVIAAKRIRTRNYATLITYYKEKDGFEMKLFNRYGPEYTIFMFLLSHFVVCMLTCTIGILCFFNFYLH